MKIQIGDETHTLEVTHFSEYPRGTDGRCALCKGDPCAEYSAEDSLIALLYVLEPYTSTCPVCEGRPT